MYTFISFYSHFITTFTWNLWIHSLSSSHLLSLFRPLNEMELFCKLSTLILYQHPSIDANILIYPTTWNDDQGLLTFIFYSFHSTQTRAKNFIRFSCSFCFMLSCRLTVQLFFGLFFSWIVNWWNTQVCMYCWDDKNKELKKMRNSNERLFGGDKIVHFVELNVM